MELGRDVSNWCELVHASPRTGSKVPPHFGTTEEDVTRALEPGPLGRRWDHRGSLVFLSVGPITVLCYSGKYLHNCIIIDTVLNRTKWYL